MKNGCWALGVFILFLCFVLGCGNNLSREKAFDIINKNLPKFITGDFQYGSRKMFVDRNDVHRANELASKGVITLKFIEIFGPRVPIYDVLLTDEGKKYCVNVMQGGNNASIIIGERKLIQITGMKISNDNKRAEVEFAWKVVNLSPFGKVIQNRKGYILNGSLIQEEMKIKSDETLYPGTAIISLYDDGWRVDKGTLKISDKDTGIPDKGPLVQAPPPKEAKRKQESVKIDEEVQSGPEGHTKMLPEQVKIRFTKGKDGVISDSATGLEWYVGPDVGTGWHQAKAWTENLTVAGGGWRMPTVAELKTLYQPGRFNSLDPIFKTTGAYIWTGQLRDSSLALAFAHGKEHWVYLDPADNSRAFAVRSIKETSPMPQAAKNRFIKSEDGIITDSATGLEWYLGPKRGGNWNQAKSWTENLTVAGGGWRMPTIPELKALFKPKDGNNNVAQILRTSVSWVWSGQLRDASSAWYFNSYDGREVYADLGFADPRAFAVRSRR